MRWGQRDETDQWGQEGEKAKGVEWGQNVWKAQGVSLEGVRKFVSSTKEARPHMLI